MFSYRLLVPFENDISYKSDVGSFTYHATKKHAVASAGAMNFTYDANGNQTQRGTDDIDWTSYNYPSRIENGSKEHQYFYDGNRQRYQQIYDNGTATETTMFIGGILDKRKEGSFTEYRHYIKAGNKTVALYKRPSTGSPSYHYFLTDHQGSTTEITTSTGAFDVSENFAAFGERRDPTDWQGPISSTDVTKIGDLTEQGYTSHTNLESSTLIHMNGRVADSLTGRFLSPDPFVFNPGVTQSFNRYSYVNNNPMTYTDPSGFCIDGILTGSCIQIGLAVISWIGDLFGGRHKIRRPPPTGCISNVSTIGCFGKAVARKGKEIVTDEIKKVLGISNRGSTFPIYSDGRFGTGACGSLCMSFDTKDNDGGGESEDSQTDASQADFETIISSIKRGLDPLNPNFHRYDLGPTTICGAQSDSNCTIENISPLVALKDLPWPVHSSPIAAPEGRVVLNGTNPIMHSHYSVGNVRVFRNTTLPGHDYHPGDVVHLLFQRDGAIQLLTIGVGTGDGKNLNVIVGTIAFGLTHSGVKSLYDSMYNETRSLDP